MKKKTNEIPESFLDAFNGAQRLRKESAEEFKMIGEHLIFMGNDNLHLFYFEYSPDYLSERLDYVIIDKTQRERNLKNKGRFY